MHLPKSTFSVSSKPLLPEEKHYTASEAGKIFQYKRLPFGGTNGVSAFLRAIDRFMKTYNLQKNYAYIDEITAAGATVADHDKNLNCLLVPTIDCRLTSISEKLQNRMRTLAMLGYKNFFQQRQSRFLSTANTD